MIQPWTVKTSFQIWCRFDAATALAACRIDETPTMPEDRSPPQDTGSESKPTNKHRWREKLFIPEGRFGRGVEYTESTEDDVANFLHNGTTKAKTRPQLIPLAPRIDTTAAPRFPGATDLTQSEPVVDTYWKAKPRQNKGLRVTFQAAAPEIIGEGGDDAELPPKEVSNYLHQVTSLESHLRAEISGNFRDTKPRIARKPSPVPVDEPTFQPKLVQRTPTGLSEIFGDKTLDDRNECSDTSSYSISASPPKRKPLPPPPVPPYHTPDQRHHSPEAGHNEEHPTVSSLNGQDDVLEEHHSDQDDGISDHKLSSRLDVPLADILAGNSVTPRASPQPYSLHHETQSSNYGSQSTFPPAQTPQDLPGSRAERKIQTTPGTLPVSKAKGISLRQIAKGLGDDSLEEFDARVQRFNHLFRLGVSARTGLTNVPFVQWIRTACWWFLNGRQGLEIEVRNQSTNSSSPNPSATLKQAYVNLAKAWWIVKEITPNHPEITRFGKASFNSLRAVIQTFGDQALAEQAEIHTHVVANMRALTMSMKRNKRLPPPDLEIQRLNLHILLELPKLPSDIAGYLVNNATEFHGQGALNIPNPFFPIPIGDTDRYFNFGRMFVEISGFSDTPEQDVHLPCVLSVLRDRGEWGAQAAIASQDGQVNLVISDESSGALPWRSVQWQIKSYEMMLVVPGASETPVKMQVKFSEKDFKTLWGIWDYTQRTKKDFSIRKDEELIFERTLESFTCDDHTNFPADPVADCRLRLFERKVASSENSTEGVIHNGFRITVITPPSMKALSVVKYNIGREYPISLSMHRGALGPVLTLRVIPTSVTASPLFRQPEDLDTFRHLLSGTSNAKEDHFLPSMQLLGLFINSNRSNDDSLRFNDDSHLIASPWSKLRIVRKGVQPDSHAISPERSNNPWLIAVSDSGTLVDRLSLAQGELQIGLSTDNLNELRFLRPPQSDMTWSLLEERTSKEEMKSICMILKGMLTNTTIRTYHFPSLQNLHSFQAIVTGFSVLYDGIVSNFAIARRRSVVPVHKKWEASLARLQILKHDRRVQLVGFFKDFSHGTCMNFILKVTDFLEIFSKSGLHFLRIVDAKFALPKRLDDESRDFVCLDTPEYPSEHDDITVGFDNEDGMSKKPK